MFAITGQVPQPIARLAAANKTPRELVVHASVGAEVAWATKVLKMAGDISENPSSRWIFRLNRADIKSDAQARVIFGASTLVTKDTEDKKRAKDKIKRRKARAKLAAAAAKAAAKAKVKSASAALKAFRGEGTSFASFACDVAIFL